MKKGDREGRPFAQIYPRSDRDRMAIHGQRGFLHRFRQRRMGMDGAVDVFRRGAEFDGHHQFLDQVTGIGANDMRADHLLGLLVFQDLHETVGHRHGARAGIRGERELAGLVSHAGSLELFLGLAHAGDFR